MMNMLWGYGVMGGPMGTAGLEREAGNDICKGNSNKFHGNGIFLSCLQ